MSRPTDFLVIQTAFLGDVVLTLPLVGRIRREFPRSSVDVLVVPASAGLLRGHPDIRTVIEFDKRGRDAGVSGLLRVSRRLKSAGYDCAIVPHRSIRSALLAGLARVPARIGFHNSAGRYLWTSRVRYDPGAHEILRNLSLLSPLGAETGGLDPPRLYPSPEDKKNVDDLLSGFPSPGSRPLVSMAPGTVWNTKRWPEENYAAVAGELVRAGHGVVLVGGRADSALCARIAGSSNGTGVLDASGKLSLLGSAELIGRTEVLVCNDSAPLHLAGAMGVRVVSIFGATVPSFGFGPFGAADTVVETAGLSCRPCSIHGGDQCPVGTFECMKRIEPRRVLDAVMNT